MSGRHGTDCRNRGQALVEVALITPFLLVVIMGTIDIGRLLFASVALEEAAQEGALYAAYEPCSTPAIEERVRSSSDAAEVVGASILVSPDSPEPGTITVSVSFNFSMLTPFVQDLLGLTVPIGSSVTATNLAEAC